MVRVPPVVDVDNHNPPPLFFDPVPDAVFAPPGPIQPFERRPKGGSYPLGIVRQRTKDETRRQRTQRKPEGSSAKARRTLGASTTS